MHIRVFRFGCRRQAGRRARRHVSALSQGVGARASHDVSAPSPASLRQPSSLAALTGLVSAVVEADCLDAAPEP